MSPPGLCLFGSSLRSRRSAAQSGISDATTAITLCRRQTGRRGHVARVTRPVMDWKRFACATSMFMAHVRIPRSPYSGVLSIFTDRFRHGLPVTVYGDGEQTRDFVSVRDVAWANGEALTQAQVTAGSLQRLHRTGSFPESGSGDLPGAVSERTAGRLCCCPDRRYPPLAGRSRGAAKRVGVQRPDAVCARST